MADALVKSPGATGHPPPWAERNAVILVPNQYKCIGCSPGKYPGTRRMATGADDDSRDSVPRDVTLLQNWAAHFAAPAKKPDLRVVA